MNSSGSARRQRRKQKLGNGARLRALLDNTKSCFYCDSTTKKSYLVINILTYGFSWVGFRLFALYTSLILKAMKMPPRVDEAADNGIYEYEENTLTISSEEIDNNAVETFDSPPENDFSEYMWMENEEEFDKEVMQRLEEEALMEECIAFMSTETTSYQNSVEGPSETNPAATSKLNPEAAEFVPSGQREPPLEETPVSTNSP